MISITNKAKDFFNMGGQLYIWGAGNIGDITGKYLNKCNMKFKGYIDQNVGQRELMINDHPIFTPDHLVSISRGETIRILVASMHQYESVVFDISVMAEKNDLNILCFVPIYEKRSFARAKAVEVYNVNRMLGYFRGQLLKIKDFPTIISNDCFAGRLYDAFGQLNVIMQTPTINTWIDVKDFLKLAENPKHYLSIKMEKYVYNKVWIHEAAAGMLDDILINFGHSEGTKPEMLMDRWNFMCSHVKWDNLLFAVRENEALPYGYVEALSKINYPYMVFKRRNFTPSDLKGNAVYVKEMIQNPDSPIENYFDILSYFNNTLCQ